MSKESYARGFVKFAAAAGVDPVELLKYAAYGDIVNAGLSSMAMGSPFAPKLYTPGTSRIKPTKEIQQEMARNAVGGVAGLLASRVPSAVRGLGRFLVKEVPAGTGYTHHGTYARYLPRWGKYLETFFPPGETASGPAATGTGSPAAVAALLGIPLAAVAAGSTVEALKKPSAWLADQMGLTEGSISPQATGPVKEK